MTTAAALQAFEHAARSIDPQQGESVSLASAAAIVRAGSLAVADALVDLRRGELVMPGDEPLRALIEAEHALRRTLETLAAMVDVGDGPDN